MARAKAKAKRQRTKLGAAYNIFLSWSGERSKAAAHALRDWLPDILQAARPWMSETDIEKGSVGLAEVARALDMKVGIICLTPENLSAEWILFEAGALSKTFDEDRTRVCTYLLGGLHSQHVKNPLGMFQSTRAEREETRKMVHSVNRHLGVDPVPEASLDRLFDKMWPDLDTRLEALPEPPGEPPPSRPLEEMVADVLEFVRAMEPQVRDIATRVEYDQRRRELQATLFQGNPLMTYAGQLYPNLYSGPGSGDAPVMGFREAQREIAKGESKKKPEPPGE
jgi:hypothetical protein